MRDALAEIPGPLRPAFDGAVASGAGAMEIDGRTPEQEALAVAAEEWAVASGASPDDAALFGTVLVRRAKDQAVRDAAWLGLEQADRERLHASVRELQSTSEICIAAPTRLAADILRSARFLTQFESGESGGALNARVRRVAEAAAFGVPFGAAHGGRPVYGYLATPGQTAQASVAQYGRVRFVLHSRVRGRTTMTIGDSLNWNACPLPLDAEPTLRDASDAVARRPPQDMGRVLLARGITGFQRVAYFEAQVHGGITIADVARIDFAQPRSLIAPADREPVEQAAAAAGIPLVFPPPPAAGRSA